MTEPASTGHRDDDAFDTIAPADVRLTRTVGADDAPPRTATPSGRGGDVRVYLALGALVLAALVFFLLLPEPSPSAPPQLAADAPAEPDGAGTPATRSRPDEPQVPPYEQLRLEQERDAAQEILARMLDLVDTLEGRAVERWGAEAMAEARAVAEDGDARFLEREYVEARSRYRDAVERLESLAVRADELTETSLDRGDAALAAGDAAAAREAFELAAAITPASDAAQVGLERAAVLDDVLALLADARDVAEDGALTAATGLVAEALELDPRSAPALALRDELAARVRAVRFTDAMSDGYGALRQREFEAARAAFERAGRLRPNAPEVDEALTVLAAEALAARIEAIEAEARALEAEERWGEAATRHEAALALDPTLAFARRGLARARDRAELDAAIDEVLAAPERLSDDAALAAARELLVRARAATPKGETLAMQIEALGRTLAVAARPVPVRLVSDGATMVTLLRFERLGTFEQRTLDLRPGEYVATGTRIGYRDVRVEFLVTADGTDGPVVVRCEQRI